MTDSNSIACPECGRSISASSKSCKYCGEPLVASTPSDATMSESLACPECGQTIKSGLTSCPHCGYERKPKREETAVLETPPPKKVPASKVIVPGAKKSKSKPKPAPRPAAAPKAKPAPKPKAAPPTTAKPSESEPPTKPKREPATTLDLNEESPPSPPQQVSRSSTKQVSKQNAELPPPPDLDADFLPERPTGVPEKKVHVFLRGLQFPVKPMDYPTLIRNIRERKISPEDYIMDDKNAWRTVADLFNLPEL
ncbi:zinc ribbon domain-containing protein [bacterium]|nr:zinc ribbon domain-containing protein [bacterium]